MHFNSHPPPTNAGMPARLSGGVLLLTLVAAGIASGQTITSKPPAENARDQSKAVVLLEPLDDQGKATGQGSGFIVTPSGAVITNLHVIQGASSVRVKLPSGDVYQTADLVAFDQYKDIAILKIKGFQLPAVRLGDSDRTEVGDSIIAISSPEGLTNSLTTGVISGVRRFETHRVFQITAPIGQGSSGGALFDSSGSVIGITTYILRSGQNINFALPINYARGMISDNVTTTLASLPASAPKKAVEAAANNPGETPVDVDVNTATRRKLGRTAHEPMFARQDEALAFFFRLVEGIGLYRYQTFEELARTAAPVKTRETESSEEYTIRYLSFHEGVATTFHKPDLLLESVELLVNWSLADLERGYGKKYRARTFDGKKTLEFKKDEDGRQMRAFFDDNGNIRSVRFSKAK